MNKLNLSFMLAAATLTGCTTSQGADHSPIASASLLQADGKVVGIATLSHDREALRLTVKTQGIAPGPHGIHLHMVGDCSAAGFTSAGAHLNPGKHQHGLQNPAGSHLGDLPNIVVDQAGNGTLEFALVGPAAIIEPQLFDSDGTAIVIHAAPDDYATDPSGNSGARIACGVFTRA